LYAPPDSLVAIGGGVPTSNGKTGKGRRRERIGEGKEEGMGGNATGDATLLL